MTCGNKINLVSGIVPLIKMKMNDYWYSTTNHNNNYTKHKGCTFPRIFTVHKINFYDINVKWNVKVMKY